MSVLFNDGQFEHEFVREILNILLNLLTLNGEKLVGVSGSNKSQQEDNVQRYISTHVTGLVTSGSFCKYKKTPYLYNKVRELFPTTPEVGEPLGDSWYHFKVIESQDKCAYEILVTMSSSIFENSFFSEISQEFATCLFCLVLEKE